MHEVVVAHPTRFAHRTARAVVTVTDSAGRPRPNQIVRVAQRRHEFIFGNIGFDLIPLANGEHEIKPNVFGGALGNHELLAERFTELYNTATLPFYWRGFEPERGKPDTARLYAAARWFAERGIAVKGHPLLWHTLAPAWLLPLSDDEVAATARARITREVTDFRGVIDTWDAINEVVILPEFTAEENAITRLAQREDRLSMVRLAFETARAANPDITLLINDFNLSERYERLIESCLEDGIRIDAIGLQSHMHQGYWGEERTNAVVERFRRFGLPLHWTETTLLSGALMPPEIVDLNDYQVPSWPSTPEGEQRQAEEMVRHYTTLFAQPSVMAVTYWGLTDDGSWLGAPSGLLRADGTAKPSFDELKRLIRGEWWLAETETCTDDQGRFILDAYRGDYLLSGAGASIEFHLDSDASVTLDS